MITSSHLYNKRVSQSRYKAVGFVFSLKLQIALNIIFIIHIVHPVVTWTVSTCTIIYYSTIMSTFYHIRSREQAKYEAVIHRSVLV